MKEYFKAKDNAWEGYVVLNDKTKKAQWVQERFISPITHESTCWQRKSWITITAEEAQKLVPSVKIEAESKYRTPVTVLFPKPQKFRMTYRKKDGKEGEYEISQPIQVNSDSIVTYCFTRKALRTFKRSGILAIEES